MYPVSDLVFRFKETVGPIRMQLPESIPSKTENKTGAWVASTAPVTLPPLTGRNTN